MARAAAAFPMSAVSQPNWSSISPTASSGRFVVAANKHCRLPAFKLRDHHPPGSDGIECLDKSRLRKFPLKPFHQRIVKIRKKLQTPLTGGRSAIGLVASMTGFPARFAAVARRNASAATAPLTARTTRSANAAASAKPPIRPSGFCAAQSPSFDGSRVPTITG